MIVLWYNISCQVKLRRALLGSNPSGNSLSATHYTSVLPMSPLRAHWLLPACHGTADRKNNPKPTLGSRLLDALKNPRPKGGRFTKKIDSKIPIHGEPGHSQCNVNSIQIVDGREIWIAGDCWVLLKITN